jgi:Ca-activated chloride channel family protein
VTFAAPKLLFLLIVPLALFFLLRMDLLRQRSLLASWIAPKFWPRLISDWRPEARLAKAALFCLALAFVVLAMARPQWGYREETVRASGVDVMIVLDVSRSMDVEDVIPSRMKKARHWIRSFIDGMDGSRVGIVAFASSSYVACPLTTDLDYVLESMEILGPSSVLNQGTDIGLGLKTALAALERGAESPDSEAERQGLASKSVLLISDGEDHEAAFTEAAGQLAKKGVRLFVLGVGTEKGGPIPIRDESGKLDGYKRQGGEHVISRFDSQSLERIASDASGKYWNMSQSESEVRDVLAALGTLERTQFQERKTRTPISRYQWPLAISILLFVLELALPLTHSARRRVLPIGTARRAAVLLVAILFSGVRANAATPVESYVKNREGLKLFSKEEVQEAEKMFGEAQSADPSSVEPQFNLGVVQLKKGDAKSAIHSFEKAARGAGMAGQAGISARSLYNLGSAYESDKQDGSALRSFAAAVRMAELAKDEALALEARKRIQKIQEQQQQKNKQSQNQQGGTGGEQQQDQQSSGSQNQDQQKQQQNPRQYEDPSVSRRREFKSDKMSPEDSERVMAELSEREKQLQAKLKKQRGARQSNNDKDW